MAAAVTTPLPVTRAGWQCPECRTCYSPDVRACHCATVRPSLADRIKPAPPLRLGPDLSPPEPVRVIC